MVQSRGTQKRLYKTSQLNCRQQCLHFCIIVQSVSLNALLCFLIFNEPYRRNRKASTHIHVIFFPHSVKNVTEKHAHIGNNSKNVNTCTTIIHTSERRSDRLRCQIQPSYETDATSDKVKESCTCFL